VARGKRAHLGLEGWGRQLRTGRRRSRHPFFDAGLVAAMGRHATSPELECLRGLQPELCHTAATTHSPSRRACSSPQPSDRPRPRIADATRPGYLRIGRPVPSPATSGDPTHPGGRRTAAAAGCARWARPQLSTNSTVPPWRQRLMHPLLTHRWYQSGLPAYRLLRVRHRAPRVINGANRGCCTAGSCTVG